MQDLPHHYLVNAEAEAEGNIALKSDNMPQLVSAPPAEFGGPGDQWSPEHLLVDARRVPGTDLPQEPLIGGAQAYDPGRHGYLRGGDDEAQCSSSVRVAGVWSGEEPVTAPYRPFDASA